MGVQVYGNGCHTSAFERDIEWLRKKAYKNVAAEIRDYHKIDKIVNGIKNGKITKENLYNEIRKLTKKVTNDHLIKRWQIITDWFFKTDWHM